MTFLEALDPLLVAAQEYARLTELREASPPCLGTIILQQSEAAKALLQAAVEFNKWGRV